MTNERILRHPNGGAAKIGLEVHVSADSFCSEASKLYGDTAVLTSTLLDVEVWDSKIFNSTLEFARVSRSVIAESLLNGFSGEECILHRVEVNTELGSQIRLKEVVAETCALYGNWALEGNARIPTGIWHRAPRFKRITGENGVDVGLTESTGGYALMACWRKHISKWLEFGPRLGRRHRWTEQQIREAYDFFTELLDVPMEGVRA